MSNSSNSNSNTHKDYVRYILASIDQVNPYSDSSKDSHNIYTIGYLAGQLANVLSEDPIRFRQFTRHIDLVSKRQRNLR